ncbi:hypothetical protein HY639_01780 [Candidatus Woesearchaeota archaeon]|nr:hypothetical protein [Candidatus Woesearchaeota archaeon]
MGLDDLLDDAKRSGNEFLSRNGNIFCACFGAVFGGINGLTAYAPPDPVDATLWAGMWFGAIFPTVDWMVLRYAGQDSPDRTKKLYLEKGPENVAAFVVPYLAVSGGVYMLRRAVLG